MTTADILRAAKALIGAPEKWTKKASARNKKGCQVSDLSPCAVCWCAYGAINKVTGGDVVMAIATDNCFRTVIGDLMIDWNDAPERTHAEVMDAFDRAIAAAASISTVYANLADIDEKREVGTHA